MKPVVRHLKSGDYRSTRWSGGTTTQLAIAPGGADYGDRDFLWRVSSATVELPTSEFTPLPDYVRYISTLQGDIRLYHDGGPAIPLSPGGVHRFDGAAATRSEGVCTDFNLMLRKELCAGELRTLRLAEEGRFRLTPTLEPPPGGVHTLALYCAQGGGTVHTPGNRTAFAAGETVLVENGEPLLACRTPSLFYLCEIVCG